LIFVTAIFLVITAPPDEGTSSAKKEAPKPVVVITGLSLFAVLYLEQLFYKVSLLKSFETKVQTSIVLLK